MAPCSMWHLVEREWLLISSTVSASVTPQPTVLGLLTPVHQSFNLQIKAHTMALPPTVLTMANVKRRICLAWNNYQYPGCPFPNCSFEYSCVYCIHNPGVLDKGHKASFCPYQTQNHRNRGPVNRRLY